MVHTPDTAPGPKKPAPPMKKGGMKCPKCGGTIVAGTCSKCGKTAPNRGSPGKGDRIPPKRNGGY